MGVDEGRPGRTNNIFNFEIKQTCKVRMEALRGYLDKKVGWDNTVLECMSEWQKTTRFPLVTMADTVQASSTMSSAKVPRSACA